VSLSADGRWRPATHADLAGIVAIAAEIHPDFPERPAVLDEKRLLFSQGCFCLANNDAVLGYALSHPWTLYDIPPLDRFLGAIPPDANCLYLHDVALLDAARGKGAARALIRRLDGLAGQVGLPALALTSVKGTRPLWEALGFAPVSDKRLDVDSYGGSATYMVKRLLRG
jgi:GNAT superfamily N-acetyltransferase